MHSAAALARMRITGTRRAQRGRAQRASRGNRGAPRAPTRARPRSRGTRRAARGTARSARRASRPPAARGGRPRPRSPSAAAGSWPAPRARSAGRRRSVRAQVDRRARHSKGEPQGCHGSVKLLAPSLLPVLRPSVPACGRVQLSTCHTAVAAAGRCDAPCVAVRQRAACGGCAAARLARGSSVAV